MTASLVACGATSPAPPVAVTIRPQVAVTRIAIEGRRLGSIAFVGPGRHELLVATDDSVAVVLPPGALATPWITLASGPAADHGWRWISSSIWGWNEAEQDLVGLVAAYGTGGIEVGLASWSPMRAPLPHVLVPINGAIAPASLQTFAMSSDTRFAVGGNIQPFVLDLTTQQQLGGALGSGYADCAAFSGRRVAIGVDSGGVLVMSLARGTLVKLDAGELRVSSLAFHPTRPVLAGTTIDERVLIWHADEPAPSVVAEAANVLAFSPDGKLLVLVHGAELVLLDARTWRRIGDPIALTIRTGDSYPIPLAFSPDSRDLVIATREQGLVWVDLDARAPRPSPDLSWTARLRRLPAPELPAVTFAHDGSITGVVTLDGKPVAGTDIELTPYPTGDPGAYALPGVTSHTGKHGELAFDGLARIDWMLHVTAPDAQLYTRAVDLRKQGHVDQPVALDPAILLRGRVVDAAGQPAADVRVTADHDLGLEPVITGADGSFAIRHLPPRAVPLFAYRADGAAATTSGTPGTAVTVQLIGAADPRIVRLAVVDASGKPVALTDVEINHVVMGATDDQGHFAAEVADDHADIAITDPERAAWPRFALPRAGVIALTYRPGETW